MPPNSKGGKGYKKGKHGGGGEVKMIEILPDQMLGRILRALGNRRFRVYCNDNKERVCKICGSMRKSEWVSEGSIVVLSLREIGMRILGGQGEEGIGDILSVVDRSLYSKLKRESGVNPALFTSIETQDIHDVKKRVAEGTLEEDDLFDRGSTDSGDDDESDSDSEMNAEEKKMAKLAQRERRAKAKDLKIKSERSSKMFGGGDEKGPSKNDDIDIDAI
jgi:initiation factor 1A